VSEFAKNAKIVHIDIDPSEIDKIKKANVAILSDAACFLAKLNRVATLPDVDLSPWHAKIDDWKKRFPMKYETSADTIAPQQAIETLWEATKDHETIITTGVWQHQMWTAQFYKFKTPRTHLTSGGLGTMGFGLPAAMGAKVAHPDKVVVNIDGDGSLQMNIQEFGTCFCEKIPIKVMLLNNQHLGMVMQWEDRFHASNRGNTYLGPVDHPEAFGKGIGIGPDERFPDFCTIARGYGWQSRLVSKPDELADAIREMVESDGPFLLDVTVPYQYHVLPMIPAGATVQDIIL
jgi:acetolactate synthase-1/2/3 large subunit